MYLLPSTGQTWIHILVLPVFEPHVHVLGEIWDTSSHPHTPPNTFPLKRHINEPSLQNVHFDLELESVQSHRKSLLKSHPEITSNKRLQRARGMSIRPYSLLCIGKRDLVYNTGTHITFATGYLKSLFRYV